LRRSPALLVEISLALALLLPGAWAGSARAGEGSGESAAPQVATSSVAGRVTALRSGAPLPFASISSPVGGQDLEADEEGRFRLDGLPAGPQDLVVAVEGYRRVTLQLDLVAGELIEVEVAMRRGRRPRNQTVVRSTPPWRVVERSGLPEGGVPAIHQLTAADVDAAPGGFGDPLRAVLKLPGVTGDEASRAWFQLRGGTPEEIVIEVDGIAIRHPTHADGILSPFAPGLLDGLSLHTAGSPVDRPGALSGALFASYLDGPTDPVDGGIDLSLIAARAHVATRDASNTHAFVLGARRSLLGAYLAAIEGTGALDGTTRADFGEYIARWVHRPKPGQQVRITVLGTHDRLRVDDANQRHRAVGAAADLRWEPRDGWLLELQVAHSSAFEDEPADDTDYAHQRSFLDADHRTHLRIAAFHHAGDRHLAWGGEVAARTRRVSGEFDDDRHVPSWAWLPLADLATRRVDLNSANTWPEASLWADATFDDVVGPLQLRFGLRLTLLDRGPRPTLGPRIGLRLPLPTGTTLSGQFALVHQQRVDALVVDRDLGGARLRPERAAHFQVGVDQRIGDHVQVGVVGWHKLYDHLAVLSTDDPTTLEHAHWTSDGYGSASGLEARATLRWGRVGGDLGYALSRSVRRNPHAQLLSDWSRAAGDPRHAVRVGLLVAIGRLRTGTLAVDYTWRSGWAIGTLTPVQDPSGGTFRWAVGALDDRRRPDQHRIAARFEQVHELRRFRLVGTVEVAATPGGEGPIEDCPSIAAEGEAAPACRTLDFLPVVMPWLGLRAEF
jgi:hypothetical protein